MCKRIRKYASNCGGKTRIISIVVGGSYNAKTFIMVGKLNQSALLG